MKIKTALGEFELVSGGDSSINLANHEPHIQKFIAARPRGGIFVDIGAHQGIFTLMMSQIADKVYAIEANPTNAALLRQNLELNEVKNVEVIEKGIWSSEGTMNITTDDHTAHSHLSTTGYNSHKPSTLVSLSSIDELIKEPVSFAKMDIEGSEVAALKGGSDFFKSKPPLLMEINKFALAKFMGVSEVDLINEINKYGYRTAFIVQTGKLMNMSSLLKVLVRLPEKSLLDVYFA